MTTRRSILEVCGYYGPYPGTFIPTLIAVGRAVEARLGLGYHCVFPAPMRDRPWVDLLSEAGITTSFLEDRRSAVSTTRALSRIAATAEPALIRSHFSRWDLQSAVVARRLGAACVWHMHTGRIAQAPFVTTRAKDLVKARLLGRLLCDRVFAVSGEIARFAVSRGIPRARVEVVLNGIDVERFSTLPARAAAREQLGIDPAAVVCLGFAWSPRLKGADILIAAATPLAEAGRLQVLLVGPREPLAAGSRPPWLHVIDPVDDVGLLFSAADCFVSASRDEGFSYAIGEAMAARLPVISSDLPGPSGFFAAGGVTTFANADVAGLRARLEEVLADQDRGRAGEANREFVQAHFSIEAHVERVINLVSEIVEV